VEFALVAPLLLIFLAVGADLARVFFIGSQLTDAAREGALYASTHGQDVGQTQVKLDSAMRAVMAAEEQGTYAPLKCPSWSNPPSTTDVAITFSNAVPPAPQTTTTVKVTTTCDIVPLVAFPPLPSTYHAVGQVWSVIVGSPQ
jgi:Flp pilus assembly protein TadG